MKFINNYNTFFFKYLLVFTSVYSRLNAQRLNPSIVRDRDARQILKARVAKQRLRYAGDYLPIYGAFCKFRWKLGPGNLAPFQQNDLLTINITLIVYLCDKNIRNDTVHLTREIIFYYILYDANDWVAIAWVVKL